MNFVKYSALGNTYVVLEEVTRERLSQSLLARICDRDRGLGSDGVLLPGPAGRVRIFNPDGSEAEMSGNGVRIYARYLWERGHARDGAIDVTTATRVVPCRVQEGGRTVTAALGRVSFQSADIPVAGLPREVLCERMTIGNETLEYSAASIGNPHCVVFRSVLGTPDVRRLGPLIENDARFPSRTNVQFVQVLDRENLRIEIWERGAGHTLASGSSSAAAAAIAHRLGRCGPRVSVHMPGGRLQVEIGVKSAVRISGPVVQIASGELSTEFVVCTQIVSAAGNRPLDSPHSNPSPPAGRGSCRPSSGQSPSPNLS